MNPSTNTKKNYLYNVICELVTTLIPLITTPYVTRILGRGGMGSYQYVLTIASYFVLFANFGVKAYGNRCIAQAKDDPDERSRVFSGIFSQQLMLSAVTSVLYLGYALAFGGEYRVIFAVFGINMLSAMLEITWLYWGMESFRPVAFSTIAVKVAVAAGIFLLVREEDDLWIYALLCSLGVIAVQLYLWCGVHRFVRFVRVPFAEIRRHFLPCLALLIPMISPTLFRSMDKLMLESMSGAEAVGLYGAAEQLQTCMLGFITGLGTVMLPRVSHLLAQDMSRCVHLRKPCPVRMPEIMIPEAYPQFVLNVLRMVFHRVQCLKFAVRQGIHHVAGGEERTVEVGNHRLILHSLLCQCQAVRFHLLFLLFQVVIQSIVHVHCPVGIFRFERDETDDSNINKIA